MLPHPCDLHTTTIAQGPVFQARNRSQGVLHLRKDAPAGRTSTGITCHCGSSARRRYHTAAGALPCLWSERAYCLLAGWTRTGCHTMSDTTSSGVAPLLPSPLSTHAPHGTPSTQRARASAGQGNDCHSPAHSRSQPGPALAVWTKPTPSRANSHHQHTLDVLLAVGCMAPNSTAVPCRASLLRALLSICSVACAPGPVADQPVETHTAAGAPCRCICCLSSLGRPGQPAGSRVTVAAQPRWQQGLLRAGGARQHVREPAPPLQQCTALPAVAGRWLIAGDRAGTCD